MRYSAQKFHDFADKKEMEIVCSVSIAPRGAKAASPKG